jgi:hypothetical protein
LIEYFSENTKIRQSKGRILLLYYYLFIKTETELTTVIIQWSEFLNTDPEAQVRFPALPKKVAGLEWGTLSLVSTIEELLDRKVTAPV